MFKYVCRNKCTLEKYNARKQNTGWKKNNFTFFKGNTFIFLIQYAKEYQKPATSSLCLFFFNLHVLFYGNKYLCVLHCSMKIT